MKRGRPRLAEGDRRSVDLRIPVTPEEKALIESAAKAVSLSLAPWARMILLQAAKEVSAQEAGRKPKKKPD